MTSVNYHLYQASLLRKIYGAGIFLFLAGQLLTSAGQETPGMLVMLIGCIVLANGEYPAHQAAKNVLSQIGDNFPKIQLSFTQDHIRVSLDKKSEAFPYSRIEKISENRDYFFLFLGSGVAYVVDKTGFVQGSVSEFRTFIASKTALKYESFSLLRTIFPSRLQKKKHG